MNSGGLHPKGRQYVHLSVDHDIAIQVGLRKTNQPDVLTVLALEAHHAGIAF
jgi:putative RNA 2'-phosphotransferase